MKSIIKMNAFADNTNVSKIIFLNNHENVPDDAEDYSANQDRSVLGWYTNPYKTVLNIAPMYGDKVIANKDSSFMFSNCRNLILIKGLENLDTSEVESMGYMFYKCFSLMSIDLSCFNTSNVYNMGHMFAYCRKLNTVEISNLDVSNIRYATAMFFYCVSLEKANMPKSKWLKIECMSNMFFNCVNLKQLNNFSIKISNNVQITDMFKNCDNLQITFSINPEMKG